MNREQGPVRYGILPPALTGLGPVAGIVIAGAMASGFFTLIQWLVSASR